MTAASDQIRENDDQSVITVLLVDDQRFIGMAVGRLLASERDIRLHCCSAAADAMARAIEVAPTLILQDLVMPDGDGLTLVGLFRSHPATAGVPVIVLSGTDDPATRARAIAAGAADYMVKLPNQATLIETIRTHARKRPGSAAVSSQPSSVSTEVTFDREMLDMMREAGGADGDELVNQLVAEFLNEASALVERISRSGGSQDVAGLTAAAHSLRGASLTIGAQRLGVLAGQLEAHAGRCPGVAADAGVVTGLADELGRVRSECLRITTGVPSPSAIESGDGCLDSGTAPV